MIDNNIDNIVKGKLEKLDFEFKDEYWKQMEQLLKADCVAETAASGIGIGAFASGFLLVSFSAIMIIISIFPWAYDFDNKSNISRETQVPVVTTMENSTKIHNSNAQVQPIATIMVGANQQNIVENTNANAQTLQSGENTEEAVKMRKLRKTSTSKKSTKVRVKAKAKTQKACIPKIVEPAAQSNTQQANQSADSDNIQNTDIEKTESGVNTNDSNKQADNNNTVTEGLTLDNDSVYIPDGKLVGDDQGEEMKDPKVEVQKDPEQPKNVKPRTKPVKHVFKKRRGLLYRLGIRK
jgi:hypothetical protein